MLAPYAATDKASRGRRYPEAAPANRSEYQRDRDRIIHSAAFRRLEYKTQVFINHEGDLFRTRLTHSIEVAQIARSIARALGLNEDLTEAIALAHDLGHTPFGHSGQDALNECLRDYGGFEHNLQSLRVVDVLEERYAEFPGLNLTFETREGILKHCSLKNARELGELGKRFLEKTQPGLEAQLVNIADEIAYNNHDVDDGLRSGLLTLEQLKPIALFAGQYDEVVRRYPDIPPRRTIYETIRRMINQVVTDLIENSWRRIAQSGIKDIEDVRRHPEPLIAYTPEVAEKSRELKRFLRQNLYAHERVTRMMGEAVKIVRELFEAFMREPGLLPSQYQDKLRQQNGAGERARIIADYIAGMTDRYAMREHERLFPGT
ncbi:MAG: deoxyguanosinetriphosphate triphosphohydrolase [Candidatus Muproteobacteria bacterium RIFCSPHIGHO2_12_FULL_60_33]|uniref:Deoxyguanosinetriphosphate triphosphohydrolase-like protein n=1 Tax=Candidatus Muproteobacteria bacterium RIFCSPLOWO2_01_FULL_60_18 TaxID=1817768 RepID=A0A1F6U4Z1_9PROT|nr:MAG: deoxyguanosinetriphosphate triphosphohydrolase [Candidatus Muproteobacteria bacterium RIFCSPHIGHO2_01_60_12]OGI52466.1 MAG: deoxyguanosinetriphosphate triphosphohydrolase [Candidatus Muproteobacteria bacterium RIFCSPLOWO2_01_FULL_60_18]OGI53715.1 MAG: deoxyguanosinetriphosphate triphosphohydrolase [Candidatus Muproteobacteria bacterium RIFCSPHIGHO2_02_FULL_60_13]OGI54403.1 MAG: deoxyguanosinetriphosphate triphosphohydrolase [Candidatus Muproteobacteria bacterium RIFCSPHIGHO2_12_FULL_60_3